MTARAREVRGKMTRSQTIVLSLVGFVVGVLLAGAISETALLSMLQSQAGDGSAALAQETGDSQGSDTGSAETTGDEQPLRVQPTTVVIRGTDRWPFRDDTENRTASLAVWHEAPLSGSPLSSENGSAQLTVRESTQGPCAAGETTANGGLPKCYEVGVGTGGEELVPGSYSAMVYAGEGDSLKPVQVNALVNRPLAFLLIVVALGVVATELVLWVRGRAGYMARWRSRRATWLDWLSEDLQWTRPYTGDEEAERVVLRSVKAALRARATELQGWLERGRKGEVAVGDMPGSQDAARDRVYPLRAECERYLDRSEEDSWKACQVALGALEKHLTELGTAAVREANANREETNRALEDLYSDKKLGTFREQYNALNRVWEGGQPPTNETLSGAWKVIQAAHKKLDELKGKAAGLPAPRGDTSPSVVAEAAGVLTAHLTDLRNGVFSPAREQFDRVEGVAADAPGRAETLTTLRAVVAQEAALEAAERLAKRAWQPLKFPRPHPMLKPDESVGAALERLNKDFEELDERIDGLIAANLGDDASQEVVLKAVKEKFVSADAQLSDESKDAAAVWPAMRSDYQKSRRLVLIGKKIHHRLSTLDRNRERWERHAPRRVTEAKFRLKSAYRALLDGKEHDAEIELERAEELMDPIYRTFDPLRRWRNRIGAKSLVIVVLLLGLVLLLPLALPGLLGAEPAQMKLAETSPIGSRRELTIILFLGVALILMVLFRNPLRDWARPRIADVDDEERWENVRPLIWRSATAAAGGLLSLVIAVILAYDTRVAEEELKTWGTWLDVIVAFTLGVLAHRALKALGEQGNRFLTWVKGEEGQTSSSSTTATPSS